MEEGLRNIDFQASMLAMSMARRTDSAFAFDQSREASKVSVIQPAGYWEASHNGLFAADHLYLDSKRLETDQLESMAANYEITETVSLRRIDPMALMQLRVTGKTDFAIDELVYDMDFPGHDKRRIRSASVTVPAIVGPYTGVIT